MRSRSVAVLVVLAVLALAGVAFAGKPVVVVVGDDAGVVAAVEKALGRRVEQVGEGELDRATAIVTVTVTPTGKAAKRAKKLTATVVVTQVADDAEVGRMVVKDKKARLPRAVGKVAWKKLGKAIGAAKGKAGASEPVAVAVAAPDPEIQKPSTSTSTSTSTPTPTTATTTTSTMTMTGTATTSVEAGPLARGRWTISVDERPFWRRLRWNDDLDQVLRRYDLAANAVGLGVVGRPLKKTPDAFVAVGGELAVGVNGSRTMDGTAYATSSSEWSLALGYGVHIAGAEIAASAAYGEHRFAIDDEGMTGGELVPDVTYRWARGGLDGRVPLNPRWTLMLRGGWRHLLGTGELADAGWFPRSSGNGLDGSAGAQLRLTRWLGAYARADVRHYFFAMNPEPGDDVIAGGAVDTYLGGAIGLAVTVP